MNKTIERMIEKETRVLNMKNLLEVILRLEDDDKTIIGTVKEAVEQITADFPTAEHYHERIERGQEMEDLIKAIIATNVEIPNFLQREFMKVLIG